jgi:ubiquinone/menaquinone biosynthesis C-methylase UbiE
MKDKMTWEETIKFIRTQPEYNDLVKFAYFEEDLKLNVERFKNDEEFLETKNLIQEIVPFNSSIKLLDIGSGNGITSIAFALKGIQVDAVEPDPSETIGAGAIKKLKELYQLNNLSVHQGFAEDLKFPDNTFDIVYTRQCMHHANDLAMFIKECFRVLKKEGLLITVRDHIVYNKSDKKWFLESHPLQKFYGGENAFSENEYRSAMTNAGFEIKQILKHFDSPINYFPLAKAEKEKTEQKSKEFAASIVKKKLGVLEGINLFRNIALKYVENKLGKIYDESTIPGRMYTFLAIKKIR